MLITAPPAPDHFETEREPTGGAARGCWARPAERAELVRARGFFSGGAGSYLGRAMPAVARRARVDPAGPAPCGHWTVGWC